MCMTKQVDADALVANEAGVTPLQDACEAKRLKVVQAIFATDTSKQHTMVRTLGHSSARCPSGGSCSQCWSFDEAIERELMDHEKQHQDALLLDAAAAFLSR